MLVSHAHANQATAYQSQFCHGEYVLCIKAKCEPIPDLQRLGNYVTDMALCHCDVVKGWNMGPGSCEDRNAKNYEIVVKDKGKIAGKAKSPTYMISTYSNRYNADNKSLHCGPVNPNGRPHQWAWCYGAPCQVSDEDPSKAVCTCPLVTSPSHTIGGNCKKDACNEIYSAEKPGADKFANDKYYAFVSNAGGNPNPPPQVCTPKSGN